MQLRSNKYNVQIQPMENYAFGTDTHIPKKKAITNNRNLQKRNNTTKKKNFNPISLNNAIFSQ